MLMLLLLWSMPQIVFPSGSILFPLLFFIIPIWMAHFFASNLAIKCFSSAAFFSGHQHFSHKKTQHPEFYSPYSEWPFVMSTFGLREMSNTFNALCILFFFSPFVVLSIVSLSRHILWLPQKQRKQSAQLTASHIVPNVINLDMVHFLKPFFSTNFGHHDSHESNMVRFFMLSRHWQNKIYNFSQRIFDLTEFSWSIL